VIKSKRQQPKEAKARLKRIRKQQQGGRTRLLAEDMCVLRLLYAFGALIAVF